MEFKVGDRVFHKVNNLFGVITSERKEGADGNFYFSVKFDNDYEWFVQEKSIISIKDAPKNPYQQKIEQLEQRIEKLEGIVNKQNNSQICKISAKNKEIISKSQLLSEDERVILRNLNKDFKWIARDFNDKLDIYEKCPEKKEYFYSSFCWRNGGCCESLDMFPNLFKFIKSMEEPYNIEELLKGEDIK